MNRSSSPPPPLLFFTPPPLQSHSLCPSYARHTFYQSGQYTTTIPGNIDTAAKSRDQPDHFNNIILYRSFDAIRIPDYWTHVSDLTLPDQPVIQIVTILYQQVYFSFKFPSLSNSQCVAYFRLILAIISSTFCVICVVTGRIARSQFKGKFSVTYCYKLIQLCRVT